VEVRIQAQVGADTLHGGDRAAAARADAARLHAAPVSGEDGVDERAAHGARERAVVGEPGVAFPAGDLLLNLVRYGVQSRPLGALFLTVLGLCLVAAMVAFSLERERILRRYSLILGQLRTWD
jgi:hypothetical protein